MSGRSVSLSLLVVVAGPPASVAGQGRPDPAALIGAQQDALAKLAFMDGTWRGTAWTMLPSGETHTITQTERVGPFLDGAIRIVEGRGYEEDGTVSFNALGIISHDPATGGYRTRSYAQGRTGDFALKLTESGFEWEIPAGPMTILYAAAIHGETWNEVGYRIAPGQAPVRFFEMNLTRISDTDWPVAGAVSPQ